MIGAVHNSFVVNLGIFSEFNKATNFSPNLPKFTEKELCTAAIVIES